MAAQDKVTFRQDLTEPVKIRHYEGVVFTGDDCGNLIKVALFDGGAPYSDGGTVSATAVLADGTTFPLTQGSITGNMVSVPLEAGALVVSGLMGLYVKISGNGIICTVLNAIFTVQVTDTGRVPAATVTTVNELVQEIKDAQDSFPADLTNLLAAVAPTFSTSTAYSAGAYVWQGGKLYRFTAAHPAGTWTGTDAVEVALGNDVADLKSAISEESKNLYTGVFVNLRYEENDTYSSSYKYAGGNATPIVAGVKYTFSINGVATSMRYIYLDDSKNDIGSLANGSTTSAAPVNAVYLRWRTYEELPDGYTKMQLESGETVTPYVNHITAVDTVARQSISNANNQITGINAEIAAINDDIDAVTDIPENLFVESESNVLNCSINSANGVVSSNANCRTVYISCSPNTTYVISKNAGGRFAVAGSSVVPATGVTCTHAVGDNEAKQIVYKTDLTSVYLVAFVYFKTTDGNDYQKMIDSVVITEGQATAIDRVARDGIIAVDDKITSYISTVKRTADVRVSNGSALTNISFVDSLSGAVNGLKFTEDLWPRTKLTDHFSHGGEMVKTEDGIFVMTPTNDVDTGDSPTSINLYTVIVRLDDSLNIVGTYTLGRYGDQDADGDAIVSGVGSGPIRVFDNKIYCFLTAKTDKYYQYYTIFDPATGAHTALTKCTLNGSAFSASRVCELAEITSVDSFECLHGLIGSNNGTYYAAVALAGNRQLNRGMILSTTDMVNYTMLVIPDLGNDCMVNFEIACCYYNGYIYISERQLNTDTQILAKLTTAGAVSQQTEIPDGQSKSVFFIADNVLYLVHNVFDRFHVEIVRINAAILRRSVSVMVSNSDNVYPFIYVDDDVLYVVSTRDSTSRVFISATTLPAANTVYVYNLLKTLGAYMSAND